MRPLFKSISQIRKNKVLKWKFRNRFLYALDYVGDRLLGKVSTEYILDIFEQQGFWSCNDGKTRLYWDKGVFLVADRKHPEYTVKVE